MNVQGKLAADVPAELESPESSATLAADDVDDVTARKIEDQKQNRIVGAESNV